MSTAVEHGITEEALHKALSTVQDPEIHRSITELDMVKEVHVAADGHVKVAIFLTVADFSVIAPSTARRVGASLPCLGAQAPRPHASALCP